MYFRSRKGTVRLALTSGHVALVTEELKPLHERFHAEAYSKGCLDENMAAVLEAKAPPKEENKGAISPEERQAKILAAVKEIVEKGDPETMNKNGTPKVDAVSSIVEFKATAVEINDAYEKVKSE